MTAPITPRFAVYFGTITLDDGEPATYTAAEIAELYGVDEEDYLAVDMSLPEPFRGGQDYMSYYHLKPLPDGRYYDAKVRYNIDIEEYFDEDFDARRNGKWAVRPQIDSEEDGK